jgi:hypothetical protein
MGRQPQLIGNGTGQNVKTGVNPGQHQLQWISADLPAFLGQLVGVIGFLRQ